MSYSISEQDLKELEKKYFNVSEYKYFLRSFPKYQWTTLRAARDATERWFPPDLSEIFLKHLSKTGKRKFVTAQETSKYDRFQDNTVCKKKKANGVQLYYDALQVELNAIYPKVLGELIVGYCSYRWNQKLSAVFKYNDTDFQTAPMMSYHQGELMFLSSVQKKFFYINPMLSLTSAFNLETNMNLRRCRGLAVWNDYVLVCTAQHIVVLKLNTQSVYETVSQYKYPCPTEGGNALVVDIESKLLFFTVVGQNMVFTFALPSWGPRIESPWAISCNISNSRWLNGSIRGWAEGKEDLPLVFCVSVSKADSNLPV